MVISPAQTELLLDALQSAFPTPSALGQMVCAQLDENLAEIVDGAEQSNSVFKLIEWAIAHGRLSVLIDGASRANPDDVKLHTWIEAHALLLSTATATQTSEQPGVAPQITRDQVGADKVNGDKLAVGNISGSNVAIGEKAQVNITHNRTYRIGSLTEPTPSMSPRPYQIPASPQDFVGRSKEIREVENVIKESKFSIVSIHGMGGVGKTTLAKKICDTLKPSYPDAHLFLDLGGTSTEPMGASDVMVYIIQSLKPTEVIPESQYELTAAYQSLLYDKKVLIFLDNIYNARQITPLIPPSSCFLIITSRQHFAIAGASTWRLSEFTRHEAIELIQSIAPRAKDYASRLSELCDNLPLAIRLAASSLLIYVDLKPSIYIELLADARQRISVIDHSLDISGEQIGIEASLQLSLNLLSPKLKTLWKMLGTFPGDFDSEAVSALWNLKDEPTRLNLSQLITSSLVEWDSQNCRYILHDILRLFAENQWSDVERYEFRKSHSTHFAQKLIDADQLYIQGGVETPHGLALYDLEAHNIQAGQNWSAIHTKDDLDAAQLAIKFVAVEILGVRLSASKRIQRCQKAIEAIRGHAQIRLLQGHLEADFLRSIGADYQRIREFDTAITYLENAYSLYIADKNRLGESIVLFELGRVYDQLPEHAAKSEEFMEKSLAIAKEIGDSNSIALALTYLGGVRDDFHDLEALRAGLKQYQEALEIVRKSSDLVNETRILALLAQSLLLLGYEVDALDCITRCMEIAKSIEGAYELGNAHAGISMYSQFTGDVEKAKYHMGLAIALFSEAEFSNIQHFQKLLENSDEEVLHTTSNFIHNRGCAYLKESNYERALSDFDRVIRFSPKSHQGYIGRGQTYQRMKDYDLALKDYEMAIELAPDEAYGYIGRGYIGFQRKNYEQAMFDFDKVIELQKDVDYRVHFYRALIYKNDDKIDFAIREYNKVSHLNPHYPATFYNRGLLYLKIGNYELAERDLAESIRLKHRPAEAYAYLAQVHEQVGNSDGVIENLLVLSELVGTKRMRQYWRKSHHGINPLCLNEIVTSVKKKNSSQGER